MNNYFLAVVKYENTAEEGKVVKVSEQYLVDALSFTEAEKRTIEEMRPFISGEFEVAKLAKQKLAEIFENENGDKWYKAKVAFLTLDEERGVEKRTLVNMLAQANDTKEANALVNEKMKGSMADYEIVSITETKILDIFKYEPINE